MLLDDGLGFQLVPWSPSLEKRLGQQVGGVALPAAGAAFFTWDWARRTTPNRAWRRFGTDKTVATTLTVLAGFRAANPGARLVYWNMMAPRRVPPAFAGRVRRLEAEEARGKAADKAFFYSDFVVEEVRA